jgi:hypothetical protein
MIREVHKALLQCISIGCSLGHFLPQLLNINRGENHAMAKKTFWQLYREYHIEKRELARKANIDVEVINCMLTHEPVARTDAIKVLNVASRLIGVRYGLDDLDVKLKE